MPTDRPRADGATGDRDGRTPTDAGTVTHANANATDTDSGTTADTDAATGSAGTATARATARLGAVVGRSHRRVTDRVARERRALAAMWRDDRAIEGLPVRLVIALVVGVASLSVMLNMVTGIEGLAVTELDVRPKPEVTTPGEQALAVTVVDTDGRPVEGATVVVTAGTARLDGVATARSDADGRATVTVTPELGPNRQQGTLEVDVKPPAGGGYADRRDNTRVLVVAADG